MISWFDEIEKRKQNTEYEKRKQREYDSFVRSSVNSINRQRIAKGLRLRDENGRYIDKQQMKISQITEKNHYKKNHECKTPDAVYSSTIGGDTVKMSVKLPFETDLTKDESEKLEADLHYAIEKVLAFMFK